MSNSLAVIVNFRISQGSVATQLKWGKNCYHSYSVFWESVGERIL